MDKKYPKSIASKQYVTVSICLGPHVTVNGIMTYTIDITVTVTITVTVSVSVTISTCLGPHVTVNGIVTYTMDMIVAIIVTITVTVGVCPGLHVVVIGITSNDYHDNLILQRIIITNKYYSCPIIAVQSEKSLLVKTT